MLSGYVSDRTIVKWRQRRGGEWLPEDRLRTALPVAFTLVPLSVLTSGFVTQYVSGETGIVFNLLCLLANGIGVCLVCLALVADVKYGLLAFRSTMS